MRGTVIKNTGSNYVVESPDGTLTNCKVKGKFRLKGIRTTNPVAVGDVVEFSDTTHDDQNATAYITAIEPRRNYIIRRASNLSKESHIIAANIDLLALVVTLAYPDTSTTFIDRVLATAEAYNVPAIIVINKTDILVSDDDKELLDAVTYLYKSIGYPVIHLSATTGTGMDELKAAIAGKTVLFSGNSGVGKSTIINCLVPGANLKTANLSDAYHTGTHTTTFSEMLLTPDGARIIDTPGVRGFGTIELGKTQVAHYFPEIFRISSNCRYGNCTHTHEPGCAVLEAVENCAIAQSRYASYLSIMEDDDEGKYRKPF